MTTTTTATPQEVISALPETAKRELAVWLLSQFDGNSILELLKDVQPAAEPVYDYEDPGPITDEELLQCAEARFLEYDREEAVLEKSAAAWRVKASEFPKQNVASLEPNWR